MTHLHHSYLQLPSVEELLANGLEVEIRYRRIHRWDRAFLCHLSPWHCAISHWHGPEQGIVCNITYNTDGNWSSGRAKYPIATAHQLIWTFGNDILLAYNIGCTFSATLAKPSISDMAWEAKFKCCTGSFHGIAHNRLCQLNFLIGLQRGAGIEDGEGNEHIYSESNALAPITQHSSAYCQHLQIHIHFTKWDETKYKHLGTSICSITKWLLYH